MLNTEFSISTALSLKTKGLHEQADAMLLDVMRANPHDPDIQVSLGQIFRAQAEHRAGSLEGFRITPKKFHEIQRLRNLAFGRFQTVLDKNPDNIPALLGMASVCLDLKKTAQSFELTHSALQLDPHSLEGWDLLGRLYGKVYQTDLSRQCAFNAQMVREKNFKDIYIDAMEPASGIKVEYSPD